MRRRRTVLAVLAVAVLGLPNRAAVSAPASTVVEVAGATAVRVSLDRPLSLGAGLPAVLTTSAPWAGLVLARQSPGAATPLSPYVAGLALVPSGRDRTPVPFAAPGASTLPAGDYVLYVLGPGRTRVQARITIPGLQIASARAPVRAGASSHALLASVAALTDRQAFTLATAGAAVVVGATSGQSLLHELAGCLLEGPVPPGVEETCGSPTPPETVAAGAETGYGPGALTAFAPQLAAGGYTGVVRAETVGLGSGVGMTTLHWSWVALPR